MEAANRDLEKYEQNYREFEPLIAQLKAFLPNVEKHFRDKFEAIGIQVLPIPKLETEKLVKMSIEGTPPFELPRKHPNEKSSEKGFRDAIAMFTILQEMENEEGGGLVITDDGRLTEAFALHAPDFAATIICVDGIPAANKHIENELTSSYREQLREESEEAKSFLLQYEGLLRAKIAEIQELETIDFGLFGVVKDENGNTVSIQKVASLEFAEIETALWKDRGEIYSRILFKLKCEAKSVVQNSNFYVSQHFSRRFPLGRPPVSAYSGLAIPETREMLIPVWFYGEANVTKVGSGWQLDGLKVDRRVEDKEDFYELLSIGLTCNWTQQSRKE